MLDLVMKNLTNSMPMLPGFYKPFRARKRRSAQQVFADKIATIKSKSFKQVGEIFGHFIPDEYLKPEATGIMSRRSMFFKEDTFWAFLGQVIDADGGCKEVIRKLQSYASLRGAVIPGYGCVKLKNKSVPFSPGVIKKIRPLFRDTANRCLVTSHLLAQG